MFGESILTYSWHFVHNVTCYCARFVCSFFLEKITFQSNSFIL